MPGNENEELLTFKALGQIIGKSPKTIRNRVSAGTFPVPVEHFKGIGPRFRRSRVEAWLERAREERREKIPA